MNKLTLPSGNYLLVLVPEGTTTYRMYPDNKHTFTDYWKDLGESEAKQSIAGYSSSQASNAPKKCNSKEHGLTGFYKNMQVSYCMDCEKVWQDDESTSFQATTSPVEGVDG